MRLNAVAPPVFTVPEPGGPAAVDSVRATAAVDAEGRGAREQMPLPRPYVPPRTPLPMTDFERRTDQVRRSEERRQRQLPVLIDTRSGRDRRRGGRRESDSRTATAIDVSA